MSVPPGPWIEQWLSQSRFNTFLYAVGGDRTRAIELYEWNATMSAAILHDLAHAEVAMRNAYNDALVANQLGALHWTEEPRRYFPVRLSTAKDGTTVDRNEQPRKQLGRALNSAGGNAAARGKVIAELTFGFWRYISVRGHEADLWLPYLRHGFIYGTSRPAIDGPMKRLHGLRNRVAHHEPVLATDLSGRRLDLLDLLGRISPDLRAHVDATSKWVQAQGQKPRRSERSRLPPPSGDQSLELWPLGP